MEQNLVESLQNIFILLLEGTVKSITDSLFWVIILFAVFVGGSLTFRFIATYLLEDVKKKEEVEEE